MSSEKTPDVLVQSVLSEFSVLRDEITHRSGAANTLLNLNITATGTVAGFVLSQRASPLLLLLLPFLSPALGLLYLDHALNIKNIGGYIKDELKPRMVAIAGDSGILGYEERIDAYERQKILRFLPWGLPVTILFSFPAVAALVYSTDRLTNPSIFALWGCGIVLTASYLLLWGRFVLVPFARSVAGGPNPKPPGKNLADDGPTIPRE
jgi:hypothetical protein